MNFHGSRIIVAQSGFKTAAPAGRLWRETAQGKEERREIEARIETPTAAKTDLLGIQFVEIMKDSAVRKTFVVVKWMFKKTGDSLGVKLSVSTREGGERAIDEIDNSRFARAGRLVCGNDASGEGLNFRGQIRSEEFECCGSGR